LRDRCAHVSTRWDTPALKPNPAGGRTPGIPRRIAVPGRFPIKEHERLHHAAAAADCTLSVLLSALINTIQFDEVGRPTPRRSIGKTYFAS